VERPNKISGEQGKYIEYLEAKLEKFSSKKTGIGAYLTIKKIVDDTNKLVNQGINIEDAEGNNNNVDLISEDALMSKDDKTFDRIFKFIDKLPTYTAELETMEERFSEEDIRKEAEIIKGEFSVENIMMNNG
jgi:hypothetical protein